jgi:hypothetical protein
MMTYDPTKRLTIEELLSHPWFLQPESTVPSVVGFHHKLWTHVRARIKLWRAYDLSQMSLKKSTYMHVLQTGQSAWRPTKAAGVLQMTRTTENAGA